MSPIHSGNYNPVGGRKASLGRGTSVSLLSALFVIIAASTQARADTIVGSGSLQSWNSSALGTNVGPYWNNASADGATANIGYCLAGGGSCSVSGVAGALTFYGSGNAAVSNIFFTGTGATVTVSFLGSNAGFADTFGWYSVDPANANVVPSTAAQHTLVGNQNTVHPTAVSQSVTFTPGSEYGFYLNNGSQTFFSQSSFNGADNYQHFAVFADGSGSYYIGVEDWLNGGDRDFNDIIVKITPGAADPPTDVPEPLPMSMIGAGLILFGGLMRYRRRSR